jgi:hypothetical protein
MKPPQIPASLQNRFNLTTSKKKPQYATEYNNAMNMSMGSGAIMPPEQPKKRNARNNKKNNDNVTIDEDIDNIISRGMETSYDTESKSSVNRKPRKKKNGPGINIST